MASAIYDEEFLAVFCKKDLELKNLFPQYFIQYLHALGEGRHS